MNKNIRSVSNRQSNTKVSSPYIKSYFTLLKEFEANKEKLLPNKPNEKKPQLIEEIYNKYSSKLGKYYKKNKNNISLYGSKKYEKMTIEKLLNEMESYKETILKQIKENPKLILGVRNFSEESNDEKMILTPMPDTQRKKIKSKKEKNEFNKAERTAVVMRIVEYTHRLKKRNNDNNSNDEVRNSEEDNMKVAIAMKNAVDTIERCWINSRKCSKQDLGVINIEREQKGNNDNNVKYKSKRKNRYPSKMEQKIDENMKVNEIKYNELDLWKAILLMKKYIRRLVFNRLKQCYRNNIISRTRPFIDKNNKKRLYFISKVIYYNDDMIFITNSIRKIQKRYREYRLTRFRKLLKKPKCKVVTRQKSPKKPSKLPIISPVGYFIIKNSFNISYLKCIQNNILRYLYHKKAKKSTPIHHYITSNEVTYSYLNSNKGTKVIKPQKILPIVITKEIIFRESNENKEVQTSLYHYNEMINEINIDLHKDIIHHSKSSNHIINEIFFDIKQNKLPYVKHLINSIHKVFFKDIINSIRKYNDYKEDLQNKGDILYLLYYQYNLKTYFDRWYNTTYSIYYYKKLIKNKVHAKDKTYRFTSKFKEKKVFNGNISPLYQYYFAFFKLKQILYKKQFSVLKKYYSYLKLTKFNELIVKKNQNEFLYRLVLNDLSNQNININRKEVIDLLKYGTDPLSNNYQKRLTKILRLNLTENDSYKNTSLEFPVYVKKLIGDRDNNKHGSLHKSESSDTIKDTMNSNRRRKIIPDEVNQNFLFRNNPFNCKISSSQVNSVTPTIEVDHLVSDNIFIDLNSNRRIKAKAVPLSNRSIGDIKGKDMVKITESVMIENEDTLIPNNYLYDNTPIKYKSKRNNKKIDESSSSNRSLDVSPSSNRGYRKKFYKTPSIKDTINLRDDTVFDCPI